jgi:hypothetical protein
MKKPTNALIIQCIGTQYSPTCFGALKCHHQGVEHDSAEIGTQCLGKLKKMLKYYLPFNAEIKSLRATLPDEIFYWGFCFLNRAFL